MRWNVRVLKARCEAETKRTLTYSDIATGSKISTSTVWKIMNDQSQSADFEVTSKLLRYFSEQMGKPLGLTDILHYEPDRNLTASELQA